MLVRSQAEGALVYLGDFAETGLEFASRSVFYTSVFDEKREMVLPVRASVPAVVVNITVECEQSVWAKRISKQLLDFGFVDIEAHAVDRVLETSILE
jgi:hypothetical protein